MKNGRPVWAGRDAKGSTEPPRSDTSKENGVDLSIDTDACGRG